MNLYHIKLFFSFIIFQYNMWTEDYLSIYSGKGKQTKLENPDQYLVVIVNVSMGS